MFSPKNSGRFKTGSSESGKLKSGPSKSRRSKSGWLTSLWRNESGASAVLFAISLPPLLGVAALAVDLGNLYLAERQLQGVADAAAAAAVGSHNSAAETAAVAQAIADSGATGIAVKELTSGEYVRDRAIAYDERFDPGSARRNALRVVLEREVPLFFGALLTGSNRTHVVAQGTAMRIDMAGFMLGTRVLTLPKIADDLLSALAKSPLGLSQVQLNLLASTNIDVVEFTKKVGSLTGKNGATLGEILDAGVPLHVAVSAMADSTSNTGLAALLDGIADKLSSDHVALGDMLDLGPLEASDFNGDRWGTEVDSYSMLRALLEVSLGDSYEVNLNTSVVGLAGVTVKLAGGYGEARSPWLTINTMNEVTLRTAETRLLIKAATNPIIGLPSILNIPVYAELASAEADMTDIVCSGTSADGVYVSVKPSLGKVAIADPGTTGFKDFSHPLSLKPATLLDALLVKVTGFADVSLGGGVASTLHFSPDDVEHRRSKATGTTDLLAGVTGSLVKKVDLKVNVVGLGIGLGGVAGLVGSTLQTVAPALDVVLTQLTGALGIKLGVADVTVDRLRCGHPSIVA